MRSGGKFRFVGGKVSLRFIGKGGKEHKLSLRSKQLARIVSELQELDGQELFRYEGKDGAWHPLSSQHVNRYLREATGIACTAKDFRCWIGTVSATRHLLEEGDRAQPERSARSAAKAVAKVLGNTVAVSRKHYIHPEVFEKWVKIDPESWRAKAEAAGGWEKRLQVDERFAVALLS